MFPCGNWNIENVTDKIEHSITSGSTLVIPMAVIIETGNHIAHATGDRYPIVNRFVELIYKTIDGETPWAAFTKQKDLWEDDALRALMARWKDAAISGQSLGDASIVDVANFYSGLGNYDVEIFTADLELSSYSPIQHKQRIPRRRQS